jgi:hypothetical protein
MRAGSGRGFTAAITIAAAALAAAGCSTSHGPTATTDARTSGGSPASSLTAAQAVRLAASHAQHVTSFVATMTGQTTGTTRASVSCTMKERKQPGLLLVNDCDSVRLQGQTVPGGLNEILNSSDIYLKLAPLSEMTGKPWIEMPVSSASSASGVDLGQLIQQAETNDPLVQTQMLASSTNVRKAGPATIDGVRTTEYTGSYPLSAGLARLPAGLRALVAPQVQALGLGSETFRLWLDDQQQVRKVIGSAQGTSEQVTSTVQIVSINQPVTASLPSASQTATVPASALSS